MSGSLFSHMTTAWWLFLHIQFLLYVFSGKASNKTSVGGRFVVFAMSDKMGNVPGHMPKNGDIMLMNVTKNEEYSKYITNQSLVLVISLVFTTPGRFAELRHTVISRGKAAPAPPSVRWSPWKKWKKWKKMMYKATWRSVCLSPSLLWAGNGGFFCRFWPGNPADFPTKREGDVPWISPMKRTQRVARTGNKNMEFTWVHRVFRREKMMKSSQNLSF